VHTSGRFEPPVFALAERLQKDGLRVLVTSYRTMGARKWERLQGGARLLRLRRLGEERPTTVLTRALRWLSFLLQACGILARLSPRALVLFSYDLLPLAILGKSLTRGVVYYCTEHSTTASWATLRTGWGVLKAAERAGAAWADLVIAVEPQRAALLGDQIDRKVDFVVWNAPTFEARLEAQAERAIDHARDELRLVYAGSLAERNLLEPLAIAVTERPGASLALFGRVSPEYRSRLEQIIQACQERRPEAVTYRGELPYGELHRTLTGFDVGVVLYSTDTTNTALAAPAKLLDYMKAGLAVLTTGQPLPARIVGEAACGIVLKSADAQTLRAALATMQSDLSAVRQMRRNAVREFRLRWSSEIASAAFLKSLRTIVGEAERDRNERTLGGSGS
jgi:glycosyltransferase involved in cell wall biosynthesis